MCMAQREPNKEKKKKTEGNKLVFHQLSMENHTNMAQIGYPTVPPPLRPLPPYRCHWPLSVSKTISSNLHNVTNTIFFSCAGLLDGLLLFSSLRISSFCQRMGIEWTIAIDHICMVVFFFVSFLSHWIFDSSSDNDENWFLVKCGGMKWTMISISVFRFVLKL